MGWRWQMTADGCTITMTLQQSCGESVFDAVKGAAERLVKEAALRLKLLRNGESAFSAVKATP